LILENQPSTIRAREYVIYLEEFDLNSLNWPNNEEVWLIVQVNGAEEKKVEVIEMAQPPP
jgi:hypothetical protein